MQHGLGLPRDLHLAKRHYDKAMEIEADSYLAVYSSLLILGLQYVCEGHLHLSFNGPSIGLGGCLGKPEITR